MTPVQRSFGPFYTYTKDLIVPLHLYTYEPGAYQVKPTWTTETRQAVSPTPVIGPSDGTVSAWFDGAYHLRVCAPDGTCLLETDDWRP